MRIEWTVQAEQMLDEALDYFGVESPDAALRWFDELMDRVRLLERFPDVGRMVPEYQRPEVRELLVNPYRVPYHRDASRITILAVMHDQRAFFVDEYQG